MYSNVHPYEGLTYSHNLYALLNSMTPQSSLPYVCFVTRLSYSCNNNICASWACYSCNSSRKDGKGVYVRDPARKKTLIIAFNVNRRNIFAYILPLFLVTHFDYWIPFMLVQWMPDSTTSVHFHLLSMHYDY